MSLCADDPPTNDTTIDSNSCVWIKLPIKAQKTSDFPIISGESEVFCVVTGILTSCDYFCLFLRNPSANRRRTGYTVPLPYSRFAAFLPKTMAPASIVLTGASALSVIMSFSQHFQAGIEVNDVGHGNNTTAKHLFLHRICHTNHIIFTLYTKTMV